MRLPEGAQDWLREGERGISSEAIFSTLSGIDISGHWGPLPPADPDDFRRCELLLRAVPEFRDRFAEMANVSMHWARLVKAWETLVLTMESEAPEWPTKGGRAPRTYALMQQLDHDPAVRRGEG